MDKRPVIDPQSDLRTQNMKYIYKYNKQRNKDLSLIYIFLYMDKRPVIDPQSYLRTQNIEYMCILAQRDHEIDG